MITFKKVMRVLLLFVLFITLLLPIRRFAFAQNDENSDQIEVVEESGGGAQSETTEKTEDQAETGTTEEELEEEIEEETEEEPDEETDAEEPETTIEEKKEIVNMKPVDAPPATVIYLTGTSGDDTKDGLTKENAVKTFEKAKEKAAEVDTIKDIIVTGTTSISGDINLEGTNAKVLRDEGFNGYLFKVSGATTVTLKNIIIDGNSENNTTTKKSLIEVIGGSTLNIQDGAVLRNNKIDLSDTTSPLAGGGLYIDNSTLNMMGGFVEGNQACYGGGISLLRSTMNFSGGTVQKKHSSSRGR